MSNSSSCQGAGIPIEDSGAYISGFVLFGFAFVLGLCVLVFGFKGLDDWKKRVIAFLNITESAFNVIWWGLNTCSIPPSQRRAATALLLFVLALQLWQYTLLLYYWVSTIYAEKRSEKTLPITVQIIFVAIAVVIFCGFLGCLIYLLAFVTPDQKTINTFILVHVTLYLCELCLLSIALAICSIVLFVLLGRHVGKSYNQLTLRLSHLITLACAFLILFVSFGQFAAVLVLFLIDS